MRSLYGVGLLVGIAFAVLASTRPSVAAVIYPWCANYGGSWNGYGASSCRRVHILPAMFGDALG